MGPWQVARLYALKSVWNSTGLQSAGLALVDALGSPDEGVRTVAGMFLVQAGKRAEPLIEEAIRRCQHLPIVLIIARGRRGPPLGTGVAALQRGRRFRGG